MSKTENVESLEKLLSQVEEMARTVKAMLAKAAGKDTPKEVSRAFKLLEEISRSEQGLPRTELHTLAKRHGYPDTRGLAGFFKGKNASLVYVPSANGREDRVFITKAAKNWLDEAEA